MIQTVVAAVWVATLLVLFMPNVVLANEADCRYDVVFAQHEGGFFSGEGQSQGILPDVMRYLSAQQRCQLTASYLPAARAVSYMSQDRLDAFMFATPGDKSIVQVMEEMSSLLAGPTLSANIYHTSPTLFLQRVGFFSRSDFTGALDSSEALLAYIIGGGQLSFMTPESFEYYFGLSFKPVGFGSATAGLKSVSNGRLDLFFCEFSVCDGAIKQVGINNLKVAREVNPVTMQISFFKAVNSADAFAIDTAIQQMHSSGQLKKIIARHADLNSFAW